VVLKAADIPSLDDTAVFGEGPEIQGLRPDIRDESTAPVPPWPSLSPADFADSFVTVIDSDTRKLSLSMSAEMRGAVGECIFSPLQHNLPGVEATQQALKSLRLNANDSLRLFAHWFLGLAPHISHALPSAALQTTALSLLRDESASPEAFVDACSNSVRIARALVLCRLVKHELEEEWLEQLISHLNIALSVRRALLRGADPQCAESLTVNALTTV